MKRIAVSVLCGFCRNKKYLRDKQCLKHQPGITCSAFSPITRQKKIDLISWAEREDER